MRTTVDIDDDTARAIEELRTSSGIGLSEAVNQLIRRGLIARSPVSRFEQRTRRLGLRIDVSNIAEALDNLDGPSSRG